MEKQKKKQDPYWVPEFVVDRSTWLRGIGTGSLQTKQGKRCCLGFHAIECGYTEEEIFGSYQPSQLTQNWKDPDQVGFFGLTKAYPADPADPGVKTAGFDTALCKRIMRINDEQAIDDEEREAKLTEMFAEMETKVIFK